MEKTIWVIEENREDMLDIQRKINAFGGIRAMCIFSGAMLRKIIQERLNQDDSLSNPSLILINPHMIKEDSDILEMLKITPKLAGIPLFFIAEDAGVDDEEYYLQGAMVVLEKPMSENALLRVRQAAAQYEMTKSYERIFQKQVSELAIAKEMQRLNIQLESRNEFLHRVFGKYFSDELLEVILERPEGEFIGGDRREIAVLMADLRGFSSKSEEMTPDELMDLLNCFFGTMVEVIAKYGGTVIEFMGDGILAVFGAPMKNERYAESAIAAAITMQNEMKAVREFCIQRGIPEVEMGIGIHCGETFVGNVGSEKMMRYNVIGRVVNECSRIEGCTIGGQVFVSKEAIKNLSCDVKIENEASIEAKGIREPLQICEISGIGGEYQCYLEAQQKEELYPVPERVRVELFPINHKVISDKAVVGRWKEIGIHNGIVEVVEACDEMCVPVFTDVEVRTEKGETTLAFAGVYAKVIQCEGRKIQVRFTHLNKAFKEFIRSLGLEGCNL